MTESRLREWAAALAGREVKSFDHARRLFCRKPNARHLHGIRTASRRLLSLYQDLGTILPPLKQRRARRILKTAGVAQDAAALRRVLAAAVDDGERDIVEPLLQALRDQQRAGIRSLHRMLVQRKRP